MEMQKDDSSRNLNKKEYKEEREKVLVPVRRRKDTREEKHSEDSDKNKVGEIRRRWYIY